MVGSRPCACWNSTVARSMSCIVPRTALGTQSVALKPPRMAPRMRVTP